VSQRRIDHRMRTCPVLVAAAVLIVVAGALSGQPQAPISCGELDSDLDRAADRRQQGDHRGAEALYRATLDAAIAGACAGQEAWSRNGLDVVAIVEGRLIDGLRHLQQAEEALAAAVPTPSEEPPAFGEKVGELKATIELSRGAAYVRLGWLDEAHDALRRTRTLHRRYGADPANWATILLQSARVHRLRGEPRKARNAVREALGLLADAKTRAALWQESAWLDLEAGRFDEAERSLGQALEALKGPKNEIAKANVIADRAELEMRRRRWAECRQWAEEALALARAAETPDLNLEAHAQYLKSMALWKLGRPEDAKRAADRGLALLEAVRDVWQDLGLNFFALRQRFYRHRLDLAVATEGAEDAWVLFESYRARGLLESSGTRAGRSAGVPDQEDGKQIAEAIDARRRELLAVIRQLDGADPANPQAMLAHEARFRAHRLALRELQAEQRRAAGRPPAPELGPGTVAEMLEAETLALVFAVGAEKIHVLALDRGHGLEVVTLGVDRRQVEDLVAKLVKGLDPDASRKRRSRFEDHVRELSRVLIGPLAERLEGFRRLVIVADGALERLPFEVLRHPGSGRRLVADFEIAYLPSFSVLAALRKTCSPAPAELFAVGDPIFGSRDSRWPETAADTRSADEALALRPLPATAGEVRTIAGLYPQGATVALDSQATRERFLAEAAKHRVIHVASHARSDPEVPERSKIALSCIDASGRVAEVCDLYFEDVATLDLCGQLVVLSACDTAGGRLVPGEGILGLPRAFLHAGAATVVASLRRVADEPTAELMAAFHRHLRAGAGPAAALRKAKLERIDAGHPPSAWAAFVLLGDWTRRYASERLQPKVEGEGLVQLDKRLVGDAALGRNDSSAVVGHDHRRVRHSLGRQFGSRHTVITSARITPHVADLPGGELHGRRVGKLRPGQDGEAGPTRCGQRRPEGGARMRSERGLIKS